MSRTRESPSPAALFRTVCDALDGLRGRIKCVSRGLRGVRGRGSRLLLSRDCGGVVVAVLGLVLLLKGEQALKGTIEHQSLVLLVMNEDDVE